jgi:magnesium transporter
LIDYLLLHSLESSEMLTVPLIVCLTMAVTVICAKLIGCILPILAKKLGFDPAVMAAPFITTIVDALSLIVYFAIAAAIIPGLT